MKSNLADEELSKLLERDTLYEAWVKANYPLPPFGYYFTYDSFMPVTITTVIFSYPGRKPIDPDEVNFFECNNKRINSNFHIAQFFLEHDKKYQFSKEKVK